MPTKIAIIEDDLAIASMYEFKLKQEGYEVKIAINGEDGVKLIDSFLPDIILLDLMLPGITGQEVLKVVRAHPTAAVTKVIVLTNISEDTASDELNKLGISRYVLKAQTTPQEVLEIIQQTLKTP